MVKTTPPILTSSPPKSVSLNQNFTVRPNVSPRISCYHCMLNGKVVHKRIKVKRYFKNVVN